MNIIEAMILRRSVRNFNGESLSPALRAELAQTASETTSPFGGSVTIRMKDFDLKNGYKPSTYGMIRGAETYFLMGIGSDEASALSAGFRFEQVMLKACMLGLGTCWIGGTFKGSSFDSGQTWPDGESLKIVCPVGTEAKSVRDKLLRAAFGSTRRKPFDTLFFSGDFSTPVSADNRFRHALKMLRLAPSSTNSQPWRAVTDGHRVHFYCADKGPFAVLDTGIALCHFYETMRYENRRGSFAKLTDSPAPPAGLRYLVSYTEE